MGECSLFSQQHKIKTNDLALKVPFLLSNALDWDLWIVQAITENVMLRDRGALSSWALAGGGWLFSQNHLVWYHKEWWKSIKSHLTLRLFYVINHSNTILHLSARVVKREKKLPCVCLWWGCAKKKLKHWFVRELWEDKSLEKQNFLCKVRELQILKLCYLSKKPSLRQRERVKIFTLFEGTPVILTLRKRERAQISYLQVEKKTSDLERAPCRNKTTYF